MCSGCGPTSRHGRRAERDRERFRVDRRPPRLDCAPVADDDFSTEVARVGDATVIHVHGEIDTATCGRLRDAIEPHLGPRQTVVLDLSGVRFMDSSCLTVLLQARGTLTADGGSLVLRNPSRVAHLVLTAAQLEHLLQTDADQHPPDSN